VAEFAVQQRLRRPFVHARVFANPIAMISLASGSLCFSGLLAEVHFH
jgi:hypothetical protein